MQKTALPSVIGAAHVSCRSGRRDLPTTCRRAPIRDDLPPAGESRLDLGEHGRGLCEVRPYKAHHHKSQVADPVFPDLSSTTT